MVIWLISLCIEKITMANNATEQQHLHFLSVVHRSSYCSYQFKSSVWIVTQSHCERGSRGRRSLRSLLSEIRETSLVSCGAR